jgi:dolichyl-diphosphooligosaccharide--protein glycosyltransferase
VGRFSRARLVRLALPAAAFLLALLVRALPYPTVFTPSGVFPDGTDAYYHLRRIAYTVVSFPHFLEFDSYVSFPDGGRPIWTPLFDFWLAALARLALGPQSGAPLERLLMWVSPLLGAAGVLAVHALARRAWGERVAAVAAFLLALLPAHFVYSQLGELDHHVAVALAVTLVLAAGLSLLRRAGGGPRGLIVGALGLGVSQAFALLLWPGCLLAVVTLDATLVACIVACARRDEAVALARSCALAHACALVVVAPFTWGSEWERWGSVSPLVLSRFQPLFFAAGAACFGLLAEFFQRVHFPASLARRSLAALALGGVVLGLALATTPGLAPGAGDAWDWFAKREVFQASVAESEPLFVGAHGFETDTAEQLFSRLICASPLLLVLLVAGARGREDARARGVLAAWTVVWLVAALVQRRFVNELSVAFALLVAVCALDALRAARRALAGRGRLKATGAGLASLAAAIWLLAPIGSFFAPYVANVRRAFLGEPQHLSGWQPEQRALTQLSRWLAAHTPATSGYWDASLRPEYGVLGAWGDGHVLRYVAQRPVVQDNFGDDVGEQGFALAEAYFAETSEPAALRIAERLRARYVVVRGGGSGHSAGYAARSLLKRLNRLNGTEGNLRAGDAAPAEHVAALTQHRLIFDARAARGPSDGSRPNYKIFEIVPGARIAGRARPLAEVRAELGIAFGRRGGMRYSSTTRAGADGRYEIVVPYANDLPADAMADEIRPRRAYRLLSDGREIAVFVSDTEVRSGARVEAPPLAD